MDLIKTGKYIADKRKSLGLTQKQVAEKLGMILVQKCSYPKNYITAVDKEGTEMKTAELLSGVDGAFLFDYHTNEKFQSLTIFISEYHFGKLAAKNKIAELFYKGVS